VVIKALQTTQPSYHLGTLYEPTKLLHPVDMACREPTSFFSTYPPMLLERTIVNYFKETQSVEPKISQKEYKYHAYMNIRDVRMRVRILKVEDRGLTYCVEFTRLSGEYLAFSEVFKEIKNDHMAIMHDCVLDKST
jgi:hypothetical protein